MKIINVSNVKIIIAKIVKKTTRFVLNVKIYFKYLIKSKKMERSIQFV